MSHDRGVTCGACGASTPLPDDLTTPTFSCAFCRATLETARYAGQQAVTADVLSAHLDKVRANPQQAMQDMKDGIRAPVFEDENREVRDAACLSCKAPVKVPMALRVREVTCGACGMTCSVDRYVPHDVRFKADMDRQVRDNEAFKRLAETGVACTKCGGNNAVPTDGTIQITCRFCSTTILLSDHADPGAIARARLKNAVFEMRDEMMAQQAESQRNWRIGFVIFMVIALTALAIANVAGLIPH